MDLFETLYSIFDSLSWLGGILFVGMVSILGFIFQPMRILTMTSAALAKLFMEATTRTSMQKLTNARMLPTDNKAKTAQNHLDNATNRKVRIQEYLNVRRMKKRDREGPYALQQFIEDLFDTNFQQWQQVLKEALDEFDRREEIVRGVIYAMQQATDHIWDHYKPQIDALELEIIRYQARWGRAVLILRSQRTLRGFWRGIHVVRTLRKCWKIHHKTLIELTKARNKDIARTERFYNARLKPLLTWLHDFENQHLMHTVHVFQADWYSSQQTVETGRTLARLIDSNNPKAQGVRQTLKLEQLPWDRDGLEEHILHALRGRVGFNPNSQIEDIFETWLRIYYIDLGPQQCPELAPLGSSGFYHWVRQLVPPGSKGLAHQEFGHLPPAGVGEISWIVPLHPDQYRDIS